MRHHYILGFQVPVDDAVAVHLLDALADLVELAGSLGLLEFLFLLHQRVERALLHVLD